MQEQPEKKKNSQEKKPKMNKTYHYQILKYTIKYL